MSRKVFYSWQKALPNATNRGFILTALKAACAEAGEDLAIEERPEVDHDTQGVPGAPDIAQTIFAKIDEAEVFVADVSIITTDNESRPCPNPNVLIELGYAIKALDWSHIILVMNTAFGGPELLPFDLKTKRVTTYRMEEQSERAPERKKLQSILREGLGVILQHAARDAPGVEIQPASEAEIARGAIERNERNAVSAVRRFMRSFAERLDELAPSRPGAPSSTPLADALSRTIPHVLDFARIGEVIAAHDAVDAAGAMFKGFEEVLAGYDVKPGYVGDFDETDFDLQKFIGHESLVVLIALLMREERWGIIASLLDQELLVKRMNGTRAQRFVDVSQNVISLRRAAERQNQREEDLRPELLKERHTTGELSKLVPFEAFSDADFFLFLRGELERSEQHWGAAWAPWSARSLRRADPPRYLVEAQRATFAEKLAPALGLNSAEQLRERLAEKKPMIDTLFRSELFWDGPLKRFDVNSIGSR